MHCFTIITLSCQRRYNKPGHMDEAIEANEFNEMMQNQRAVLASVVFEEFLKELSAIAQEHYTFNHANDTRQFFMQANSQNNFQPIN